LVSKNQTINQVWFWELEHDVSKELGSQKHLRVWLLCGKVQLLRVRMHSLSQFCLWEAICLFDLVWAELTRVPIMLYEIFFSYTVGSYWLLKPFSLQFFCTFWFFIFWFFDFFFQGKKSSNLWVIIQFNFCLKKRDYVLSEASNLVVDATCHKTKRQHATRKTCTHMFLSCICACWKNALISIQSSIALVNNLKG
jgi:hypothetical protein